MHSAIHNYTATQRHADAVREARRAAPRPTRTPAEPSRQVGLVTIFARSLLRTHTLRAAIGRR
jgi:glyceraldehyde-3-phosphate dehydrogenase/erythrose-4-phosphate dehydrogenase